MKSIFVTLFIGFGVALTILADVALKKSNASDWRLMLFGFLVYGLVAIPVAVAFKYTEFGKLFLVWEAAVVICGVVVASWLYKEPFTSYRFIALLLALIAMFFAYK